ncbi:MAG: hypothetical protein ACFCUN_08965 [Hyphomicrobiaceae bacterium]
MTEQRTSRRPARLVRGRALRDVLEAVLCAGSALPADRVRMMCDRLMSSILAAEISRRPMPMKSAFAVRRPAPEASRRPDAAAASGARDGVSGQASSSAMTTYEQGSAGPEAAAAAARVAGSFDPYAFGLVPTFQKQGRDAVSDRLAEITDVGHLKAMARAQQIALPASVRRGSPTPDEVRLAILDAVEKRIADRRAAAS